MSRPLPFVFACLATLTLAPVLSACGDDEGHHGDDYEVIEDCIEDHIDEGLIEPEAVAHCLVDYPDLHPDFADQAECVTFVDDAGYPDSSEASCETYFEET